MTPRNWSQVTGLRPEGNMENNGSTEGMSDYVAKRHETLPGAGKAHRKEDELAAINDMI